MSYAPLLAACSGFLACLAVGHAVPPRGARGRWRKTLARVLERYTGHLLVRVRRRPLLSGLGLHGARDRLDAVGIPSRLGMRELLAVKLGAALAGLASGLVLGSALSWRAVLVFGALGLAAGFLAPDSLLARQTRKTARLMADELPDVLDLVRICVRAGMPLDRAIATAAQRIDGPLAGELKLIAAEQALGLGRRAALDRLARRARAAPEVVAFARAVQRADRHGAPIAEALASQARAARESQRRRVQERAAKAGPKIQLVVALVLVPSALLMVAAALLAELLSSSGPLLG